MISSWDQTKLRVCLGPQDDAEDIVHLHMDESISNEEGPPRCPPIKPQPLRIFSPKENDDLHSKGGQFH